MIDAQQRAFNKLSRLKVGALFMETGTGKTKVALDLLASKSHKCDFMLWICPCSLKSTIETERKKWHSELHFEVVGCESIGSSSRIFLELLSKVEKAKCAFLIVDESLKIKNLKAKRTDRILALGHYAKYKLILNGTPLTKNVLDLYPQLDFLSPLILNEDFHSFKDKYCEYYLHGELRDRVRKCCNIPHLISRIKPYIFDAKLDLKADKEYEYCQYRFTPEENDEYIDLKYRILSEQYNNDELDFYKLITALQRYTYTCQSKLQTVEKVKKNINGKVVIFVKYLNSIPEQALKVIGEMSLNEREVAIRKFREDPDQKELYITYGCGAFGLNLQFADNMIFADRTWDLAQMEQAEARIFRLGQKKDIVKYFFITTGTGLEHMIDRNLKKKTDLLKEVKETLATMNKKEQVKWLKKHL